VKTVTARNAAEVEGLNRGLCPNGASGGHQKAERQQNGEVTGFHGFGNFKPSSCFSAFQTTHSHLGTITKNEEGIAPPWIDTPCMQDIWKQKSPR